MGNDDFNPYGFLHKSPKVGVSVPAMGNDDFNEIADSILMRMAVSVPAMGNDDFNIGESIIWMLWLHVSVPAMGNDDFNFGEYSQ